MQKKKKCKQCKINSMYLIILCKLINVPHHINTIISIIKNSTVFLYARNKYLEIEIESTIDKASKKYQILRDKLAKMCKTETSETTKRHCEMLNRELCYAGILEI